MQAMMCYALDQERKGMFKDSSKQQCGLDQNIAILNLLQVPLFDSKEPLVNLLHIFLYKIMMQCRNPLQANKATLQTTFFLGLIGGHVGEDYYDNQDQVLLRANVIKRKIKQRGYL
ncbi:hypothetical protein O6H91_13G039700 [Diphasiastrum complanatum]|uniref:Uncharacterized protein n=1 Tax=Diphasiastrum complanatum TaxID=34168 RepID=A0ACC2BU28_DIPCM|nr:hypothetical protein O6H91_13G039700 [Diphasiastrum complanatum]